MADGSITHNRHYKISFSSQDKSILVAIKNSMHSDRSIYHEKRSNRFVNVYEFYVYSKQIYTDIIKLGGQTNKSNKLMFPKIPNKYLADFVRGYFDGDGSVFKTKYKSSKNGRFYTEIRSNFTCGNKIFLERLMKVLYKRIGVVKKKIGQYGPHQFKLGYSHTDTEKLLKFMYYPGHKISLKRKMSFLYKHV